MEGKKTNIDAAQQARIRAVQMEMNDYKELIRADESFRSKAYKPQAKEEHMTIGYGHYGADVKKGSTVTREEAEVLLDKDVRDRMVSIRGLLTEFDYLPRGLKRAIFSEHYRGSVQQSPNTVKLINAGEWADASLEFLDNDQYRNAEALKIRGIRPRMERVSKELMKLAQ